MKIPEGWPTDVMIEVGANVISAAGRCDTWEEASAAAKHIYKAMSEYAPTPPAQEAEPVARVRKMINSSFIDSTGCKGYWGDLPDGTPLYTRPASDKLRQAAEEAIKLLEDSSGGYCREAANLRAALEGKS
jgi:hypothetical protein